MEIINMTGFDAYIADESGEFNIYPVKGNLQHILDFPKAEMNFSFPTNNMMVYVYDTLKDMQVEIIEDELLDINDNLVVRHNPYRTALDIFNYIVKELE